MRCLLLALAGALALAAQTESDGVEYKFHGSVGSETHLTPNNADSPLNPGGVLGIPLTTNSSDVTLYGDIAPASRKWKFHFKLRNYADAGNGTTARGEVSELYWDLSVTPWMDVQVGRKIEKWGTGYGWNPTGVVNPLKDPRDPTDRLDAFRGVDEVSVDLFLRGWNFAVLATPMIPALGNKDRGFTPVGWAARAYRLIHGVDFSVSASGGSGLPNSQGVSVSRVFGKALELHAEAAGFHNTPGYVPASGGFQLEQRPHAEFLAGGQYTFPHNVNIVVEYYHNGGNLSGREWTEYQRFTNPGVLIPGVDTATRLTLANEQFAALQMGRDYAFNRIAFPIKIRKLEAETIAITSLRDGSSVIRPALFWYLTPNVQVYCLDTEFTGRRTTELGMVPIRREVDIGVRFHF